MREKLSPWPNQISPLGKPCEGLIHRFGQALLAAVAGELQVRMPGQFIYGAGLRKLGRQRMQLDLNGRPSGQRFVHCLAAIKPSVVKARMNHPVVPELLPKGDRNSGRKGPNALPAQRRYQELTCVLPEEQKGSTFGIGRA